MAPQSHAEAPSPEAPTSAAPAKGELTADVAVIGGGVVGHAIAWQALQTGRSVVLVDDAPGSGASWAAAGMLAPVSELHYQEQELLELMLEASRLWPDFAAGLAAASSTGTGYLTTPTLAVGADPADRQALADLRAVQTANGLVVEALSVREARSREPLLTPGISCAFDIPADHQVDPRRLLAAMATAFAGDAFPEGASPESIDGSAAAAPTEAQAARAGTGRSARERGAGLLWEEERVAGIVLGSGRSIRAGETVVANGLGAGELDGLPAGLRLPLRPVYGDILRLRVPRHLQPLLSSTVRGLVHGVPVYIVPRDDGTVVIGATQREDALGVTSSERAVSAGGVYQLLRDAQVLVPGVAELELLECTTRARPATPDNAPLLGRVAASSGGPDIPGLIIATGFFRHGILLAPAAAAICSQLMEGRADRRWAAFRPDRFSGTLSRKSIPRTPDQQTRQQQTMPSAAAVKASGTTLPTKETT